jgi:hypothetical protein
MLAIMQSSAEVQATLDAKLTEHHEMEMTTHKTNDDLARLRDELTKSRDKAIDLVAQLDTLVDKYDTDGLQTKIEQLTASNFKMQTDADDILINVQAEQSDVKRHDMTARHNQLKRTIQRYTKRIAHIQQKIPQLQAEEQTERIRLENALALAQNRCTQLTSELDAQKKTLSLLMTQSSAIWRQTQVLKAKLQEAKDREAKADAKSALDAYKRRCYQFVLEVCTKTGILPRDMLRKDANLNDEFDEDTTTDEDSDEESHEEPDVDFPTLLKTAMAKLTMDQIVVVAHQIHFSTLYNSVCQGLLYQDIRYCDRVENTWYQGSHESAYLVSDQWGHCDNPNCDKIRKYHYYVPANYMEIVCKVPDDLAKPKMNEFHLDVKNLHDTDLFSTLDLCDGWTSVW